jgi:choice-of-anchor A domain-containing protein
MHYIRLLLVLTGIQSVAYANMCNNIEFILSKWNIVVEKNLRMNRANIEGRAFAGDTIDIKQGFEVGKSFNNACNGAIVLVANVIELEAGNLCGGGIAAHKAPILKNLVSKAGCTRQACTLPQSKPHTGDNPVPVIRQLSNFLASAPETGSCEYVQNIRLQCRANAKGQNFHIFKLREWKEAGVVNKLQNVPTGTMHVEPNSV